MFKKFDGIIVDEIACYEETVKMKLPKDYKEFLLNTNGGQYIDEIHMFWVDELKETWIREVHFLTSYETPINTTFS